VDNLTGMLLWCGVGAPTTMVMALLTICATQERVGLTVVASLHLGIVRVAFYPRYALFQHLLLEALREGLRPRCTFASSWCRSIARMMCMCTSALTSFILLASLFARFQSAPQAFSCTRAHVTWVFFAMQVLAAFLPLAVIADPALDRTSTFIYRIGSWRWLAQGLFLLHHIGHQIRQVVRRDTLGEDGTS
jgi:hypothetical protein